VKKSLINRYVKILLFHRTILEKEIKEKKKEKTCMKMDLQNDVPQVDVLLTCPSRE